MSRLRCDAFDAGYLTLGAAYEHVRREALNRWPEAKIMAVVMNGSRTYVDLLWANEAGYLVARWRPHDDGYINEHWFPAANPPTPALLS